MIRYLALGDSYTIGEGVEDSCTWPYQLAVRLERPHASGADGDAIGYRSAVSVIETDDPKAAVVSGNVPSPRGDGDGLSARAEYGDIELAMTIDVVARTGWTADELLAALDQATLSPPYDLVSVLVGVNDQYRDREVAEHLPHFNTLLSQAIAYADGDAARVFVVSIPDWGVTDFAAGDARGCETIASAIDAYNLAQRELCEMRGIAYADITSISRELASDASMFIDDRLHPSAAQYACWLDAIRPVAHRCLR